MNEPTNPEHLLSDLAHEFTERLRHGEAPSMEEYAQRYPELAADIHDIFATLILLESSHSVSSRILVRGQRPSWQLRQDRLGDYRIVREVGRGGMGVVYEAIQETLGRRVALKLLPKSAMVDARQVERFRREARATANLHHTNIVPVFDVGEADGLHFYAMQFIVGQPLSELLAETQRASSPLRSLARGLQHKPNDRSALPEHGTGEPDERTRPASPGELDDPTALAVGPAVAAVPTGLAVPRGTTEPSPFGSHVQPKLAGQGRVEQELPVETGGGASAAMSNSSSPGSSRSSLYRHIARVSKQVADALAYAHGEGVIHRDIKPSNLLLDARGTVWVTDFGLARVEGQDELTSPGDVVGTLRYLPPERFEGHVDERGDIYSLGVTLYEMLTSRPAFAASTRARLIDQILHAAPAAPRRIDPRIPRDLETIVLKAMSREPTQRYPRASALADDLDRFITGRPISARRLSAWGHTWRWCRRNKALSSMIALAAALLVTVCVLAVVDSVRSRDQLHLTQLARREARGRLFDSLVSQAHARVMARSPYGRRFETLAVVRQAASLAREMQLPREAFDRLRNEAIVALCLADEEIAQTIDAFPVGTLMVDFDPQLQRYARGAIDGSVTIHRVSDNRVLQRLPRPRPDCKLAVWDGVVFSPDGTYLQQRCVDRGNLRLWNTSGSEPQLVFESSEHISWLPEFAPDGQHFGYTSMRHSQPGEKPSQTTIQARVIDIRSGREVAQPIAADETSLLIFHPTERQLAISDASAVRIIQWETGEELSRWNRGSTQPMAWSRDGRQLLARSIDENDPKIYRWDVERRRELPMLVDGNAVRHPDNIVFSHRGDRFVRVSRFRLQLWEYPSGRLLWDSSSTSLPKNRFSQDDKLLAGFPSIPPEVHFLRVADGRELRRSPLARAPVGEEFPRAVLSRDGRILAAPSAAGTHLLDLETYEELAVIPGQRLPLVFEADGSLLTHANSPEGVVRWPIHIRTATTGQTDADQHNQPSRASGRFVREPHEPQPVPSSNRIVEVTVGAAQSLTELASDDARPSLFAGLGMWSASAEGRVIATPWQRESTGSGAQIFISDPTDSAKYRCIELGLQHDVRFTSVSPDGEYVATGSTSWAAERDKATDSVTVWDSTNGQRIKDLVIGQGTPFFSPDGKWLAVVTNDRQDPLRLWRVGSWQPGPTPAFGPVSSVAFDPLSRLMATSGQQIRLLIPETGREVARLAHPDYDNLAPTCFTPDGHRLIGFGASSEQWSLLVWDLRLIGQGLAELGLDWDAPPFAAVPSAAPAAER